MTDTTRPETMQHTPGPWREGPTDGIGQRGKLIVVDANGVKVADCEADRIDGWLRFARPQAEDTANARLIAAAPDLLQALRDLVAYSECSVNDADIWNAARAALAKAESRS